MSEVSNDALLYGPWIRVQPRKGRRSARVGQNRVALVPTHISNQEEEGGKSVAAEQFKAMVVTPSSQSLDQRNEASQDVLKKVSQPYDKKRALNRHLQVTTASKSWINKAERGASSSLATHNKI